LSRNGGASQPPFDSLNLASYVGDNPECVTANLEIAAKLVFAGEISVMNAEHGNTVNVVTESGIAPLGDGLITTKSQLALASLAADCVPFGLVDPVNRVIAVGHAGWRGVLANVMQSLLDGFVAIGGQLNKTQAVIGPAICAKCYEVPSARVDLFRDSLPEAVYSVKNLDLSVGVVSVLSGSVEQVHQINGCTMESSDLFSYRRAAGKPSGRGGLIVAMGSEPQQ
jgi:hypothetical protein